MNTHLVKHDGDRLLYDWHQIIDQGRVWIDRHGVEHEISTMSKEYRTCALNWLINTHGVRLLAETVETYIHDLQPSGDMASYYFDQERDSLLQMTPSEFILNTELGEALSA